MAHSYHRSEYFHSANAVSGYSYKQMNNIKEYFGLRQKNEDLARENARLKELLFNKKDTILGKKIIIPNVLSNYIVRQAKVIDNSYEKQENFITLDRGSAVGIRSEMGVVSDRGVVGVIEKTTNGFATVISVLNTNIKINGKPKNTNHFGTIEWDGKNTGFVQLVDLPKLTTLKKGDTIVTSGQSLIFPENIPIGRIDKIFAEKNSNKYVINIRLFNDMTSLSYVYVIENKKKKEFKIIKEATEKLNK